MKISPISILDMIKKNNTVVTDLRRLPYYIQDSLPQDEFVVGFDGFDESEKDRQRAYLRILEGTREGDLLCLQYNNYKSEPEIETVPESDINKKYIRLKNKTYIQPKTQNKINVFNSIADSPDSNGVRGKFPLSKKKCPEKVLQILKSEGIETIIDLRESETCPKAIIEMTSDYDIEYFNFPVQSAIISCNEEYCNKLTKFFNLINKGNFFIGCSNGESRTDLALGINYACNQKAKNVPDLKWLMTLNHDTDVTPIVIKINKYVSNHPEIVKTWGWNNIEQYNKETKQRLEKIYTYNR